MPVLTFPAIVAKNNVFGLRSNTMAFSSPINRDARTKENPGAAWFAAMEFSRSELSRAEMRTLAAFLAQLRGMSGRFYLYDHAHPTPLGNPSGTPKVRNRKNLATFSEDLTNAAWIKTAASIAANAIAAPDGALTADKVVLTYTNSFTAPNAFDDAAWVKAEVTVTANAGTASDGTATADLLTETTAAANHQVSQVVPSADGQSVRVRVRAKTNGRHMRTLVRKRDGAYVYVTFDLVAGAIDVVGGTGIISYSIVAGGNSTWLCTVDVALGTGTNDCDVIFRLSKIPYEEAYAGDGAAGIYLDNAEYITYVAHYIDQRPTAQPVATNDWSRGVYLKAGEVTEARVDCYSSPTTSRNVYIVVNLTTGALVSQVSSAGTTLGGYRIIDAGGGWWRVVLDGINFDNSDTAYIWRVAAQSSGSQTIPGDNASGFYVWGEQREPEATCGPYVGTTDTPITDEPQTGVALYSDEWAPSTRIFEQGDYFQAGDELKIITAPVDSNAVGIAMLTFEPPLRAAPADNAAIVWDKPKCIMRLSSDDQAQWRTEPPLRSTIVIDCVEAFTV